MTGRGEGENSSAGTTHQCLECGASVQPDASSCNECGNERLILPSRWTPNESESDFTSRLRLGHETGILIGLTLALFLSLTLLSGARHRTEALLSGEKPGNMQIASASIAASVQNLPSSGETVGESSEDILVDIESLRELARECESKESWREAADAWALVIEHPENKIEDFLNSAQSREKIGDNPSAIALLNRACVRYPEDHRGYLRLGALQERLGNTAAAMFQYQVGLSFLPDNPFLLESMKRCEKMLEPSSPPWDSMSDTASFDSLSDLFPRADQPESLEETPDESVIEESTDNREGLTTLIGDTPEPIRNNLVGNGQSTQVEEKKSEGEEEEPFTGTGVTDLRVVATRDSVTIEVVTDGPAELVSSHASDPPRLVVRLPNARILNGASVPSAVNLNTDLVERVNLFQTSTDSNVVLLVVYLGENTRHTVGSDVRTVRVTITGITG
ncbi:MAG TPA: AMIN domain-containing protein [Firmicutes bacterium]|nr:AMIN domain-containing protein [Bacillota bacterium]